MIWSDLVAIWEGRVHQQVFVYYGNEVWWGMASTLSSQQNLAHMNLTAMQVTVNTRSDKVHKMPCTRIKLKKTSCYA